MEQKIDEIFVKKHTLREIIEIVRLEQIFHEELMAKMRVFCSLIFALMLTLFGIYFFNRFGIDFHHLITIDLLVLVVTEVSSLVSLREYCPIVVVKKLIAYHDYGAIVTAIHPDRRSIRDENHDRNRDEIVFLPRLRQ